ncbi:uncharacterized protein LOC111409483 [Olea europaea var. sylvestris]|uniref:uncharacterized protein LOC111409483 n=1 Tax=Olea europaea var. sylvestris TaxID=158386 RepID=UPI000C1D6122|nr:uncharacterized protein LOC111409483 [Olea europaea var. sylvestris]
MKFFQTIKIIIDHPVSDDDLTQYILNGLGLEFREIVTPIHACKISLKFKEIHDLLGSLERTSKIIDPLLAKAMATSREMGYRKCKPKCQWCDQVGYKTKACPKMNSAKATSNYATTSQGKKFQKWLVDSKTSQNTTIDLLNVFIHSECDGTNEVGLGSGLPVSHIGSLSFASSNRVFHTIASVKQSKENKEEKGGG